MGVWGHPLAINTSEYDTIREEKNFAKEAKGKRISTTLLHVCAYLCLNDELRNQFLSYTSLVSSVHSHVQLVATTLQTTDLDESLHCRKFYCKPSLRSQPSHWKGQY